MKLRLLEESKNKKKKGKITDKNPSAGKEKENTDGKDVKETVIAKLLQNCITYHVLYELKGKRLAFSFRQPSHMIALEDTTGVCISAGLERTLGDMTWAKGRFGLAGRLSISDEASSITVADARIAQLYDFLKLHKILCKFH